MSVLDRIKQQAAKQAEVSPDMNETHEGGGGRIVPEGPYVGRLVEYIDFGVHPEEFGGQAKDPSPAFQIGAALFGEGAQDAEGRPYIIRSNSHFPLRIKRHAKATTAQIFAAMNYKNDPNIRHFAQFLGEPFIFHVVVKKSKSGREFNDIDWVKTQAPMDPMSRKPYEVPALADEYYKIFLWDFPTKEDWDKLYIEGVFDDGKSKNFIQERILSALNYQGSELQLLLEAEGVVAPEKPQEAQTVAAPSTPPVAPTDAPEEGLKAPEGVPSAPTVPVAPPVVPAVAPAAPVLPSIPGQPA